MSSSTRGVARVRRLRGATASATPARDADAAASIARSSLLEHRQNADEGLDQRRIEAGARLGAQDVERLVAALRQTVRPIGHQRAESIDDRDDARAERNLLAAQRRRIAGAVPALVVALDERRHRQRERHVANDVGADPRVDPHFLELFGR